LQQKTKFGAQQNCSLKLSHTHKRLQQTPKKEEKRTQKKRKKNSFFPDNFTAQRDLGVNTKGGLGFEDQSKQSKEKAGNKMIKVIRLPRRKRERERERETYTHTHTHTQE
jgi:hypothetical protein